MNPNAASSDKVFFNNQEVMTSSLGTDLLLMESIGKVEKTFYFHKIDFVILTSLGMGWTNFYPHFQNSSRNYFTSIPGDFCHILDTDFF